MYVLGVISYGISKKYLCIKKSVDDIEWVYKLS